MKEERSSDQQGERDSQLSAMFDGELSAAECELIARRLARDESLRAQWSRFALIGAALRAERGVKLTDNVAIRVQAALAQEPAYGDSTAADVAVASARRTAADAADARVPAMERWMRFARPLASAGIAAGVAAVSILWLQSQGTQDPAMVAQVPAGQAATPAPVAQRAPVNTPPVITVAASQSEPIRVSNGEPERYITPAAPSSQPSIALPARFANYVVAHSEYSGPLTRRMALLGIVGTEASSESVEQPAPAPAPAKNNGAGKDAH